MVHNLLLAYSCGGFFWVKMNVYECSVLTFTHEQKRPHVEIVQMKESQQRKTIKLKVFQSILISVTQQEPFANRHTHTLTSLLIDHYLPCIFQSADDNESHFLFGWPFFPSKNTLLESIISFDFTKSFSTSMKNLLFTLNIVRIFLRSCFRLNL